jgi:hypothetical protein
LAAGTLGNANFVPTTIVNLLRIWFMWFSLIFCYFSHIKGGVDAKELFHLYIMLWIQDKRLSMLEVCKLDKVHMLNNSIVVYISDFPFGL